MSSSAFDQTIPYYLSAKTAEKLFQKMLKNNTDNGTNYHYYSIYSDGKNHYAWYHICQKDVMRAKIQQAGQRSEK